MVFAGIAVMFLATSAAGVVSGATAVLAGLGLGWKTIGSSLERPRLASRRRCGEPLSTR